MSFVYGDRVKETSITSGTGTLTLDGPTAGFVPFATGVGLTNECFYGIVDPLNNTWEMGRGTLTSATTFSRDTVLRSTNSDLLVPFTADPKFVYTTSPGAFFNGALDATKHGLVDHTVGLLSLLDSSDHQAIDHTAGLLNLMNVGAHDTTDHKLSPFDILDATTHEGVVHTIAPFNLLNETTHGLINHLIGPLFLLNVATHNTSSHAIVPDRDPPAVSDAERTSGTELGLRSFSPADIKTMAVEFGIGSGGASLQVAMYPPTHFSWSATGTGISTGTFAGGIGFTPTVAFAFGSFHHGGASAVPSSWSTLTQGIATSSSAFSYGQLCESSSDGNQDVTTYATGSIAGFGSPAGGPFKTSWDIATINVGWNSPSGQITLTPSIPITGNISLIVLG